MGCPSEVEIGDPLVFTVTTYSPSTATDSDADAVPSYSVYENESATPILSGDMTSLPPDGLYSESILCSAGNGFRHKQTYTIYTTATVEGTTGSISMGFKAYNGRQVLPNNKSDFVFAKDAVSQLVDLTIYDSGNLPATGLTSADIQSWYYLREGAASGVSVSVNAGTVGTFGGADVSGTLAEISATYMPGRYEFGLPNNSNVTGADRVIHTIKINGASQVDINGQLMDAATVDSSGRMVVGKWGSNTVVDGAIPAAVAGTPSGLALSSDISSASGTTTVPQHYGLTKDATSVLFGAYIVDSGGVPKTGLSFSDIQSWHYLRAGDASSTYVNVGSGVLGTYGGSDTSGTLVEVNPTGQPGKYELGLPNNGNATGADRAIHTLILNGARQLDLSFELLDTLAVDASGRTDIGRWLGNVVTVSSGGLPNVNMDAVAGSVTGAINLSYGGLNMQLGTVLGPTLSTTQMDTNLVETGVNQFVDRMLIWMDNRNEKQAKLITAYDGAGQLTYEEATAAPASGDTFIIV